MQSTALRYFSEVVRCGSFKRAAEVLHIAPSAISRQIALLEHRLKAPLFERQTNRLVLTEEGRIVAEHAARMDEASLRMIAAIDDVSELRRGKVRIAAVEAMALQVLPQALSVLQSAHPNITAFVDVLGTENVVHAVATDRADVGIAFCPIPHDDLQVQAEFPHPLYLVVSSSHPLAASREVSLSDLNGFRVALPGETFGIRRLIEDVARRRPTSLTRIVEANSIAFIKAMVCHSQLISFLPLSAILPELERGVLTAIPAQDPEFLETSIKVLAMKGRGLSRATKAFLEVFNAVGGPLLAPR